MMTEQPHAPIFPVRHIGGTVLNFLRFLSLVVALLTFVLVSQPTLDNKHRRSCLALGRSVSGWGLVTYGAVVLQPNRFRFRSILRKVPGLSANPLGLRDNGFSKGGFLTPPQDAHVCLSLGGCGRKEPASPQPPPMAGIATGKRAGSTCGRY